MGLVGVHFGGDASGHQPGQRRAHGNGQAVHHFLHQRIAITGLGACPRQLLLDGIRIHRQVQRLAHQGRIGGAVHRTQPLDRIEVAGVGDDDGEFAQLLEFGGGGGCRWHVVSSWGRVWGKYAWRAW